MTTFVDGPPPPGRSGRSAGAANRALVADLRRNPGKWAEHPTEYASPNSAANAAANIRIGTAEHWRPAGHFEAVARGVKVYVRFVGGGAA